MKPVSGGRSGLIQGSMGEQTVLCNSINYSIDSPLCNKTPVPNVTVILINSVP